MKVSLSCGIPFVNNYQGLEFYGFQAVEIDFLIWVSSQVLLLWNNEFLDRVLQDLELTKFPSKLDQDYV